jgi:sugar (pentulose or hexulose) kinase
MEGVAFHLRQCVEVIEEWGQVVKVPVIGAGGSRSPLWRQIVADVLGRPLRVPASPELAGLGAAILAGVGTGSFADVPAAVRAMVHEDGVVTPRDGVRGPYDRQYRRFRQATDWLLHSGFNDP